MMYLIEHISTIKCNAIDNITKLSIPVNFFILWEARDTFPRSQGTCPDGRVVLYVALTALVPKSIYPRTTYISTYLKFHSFSIYKSSSARFMSIREWVEIIQDKAVLIEVVYELVLILCTILNEVILLHLVYRKHWSSLYVSYIRSLLRALSSNTDKDDMYKRKKLGI